MNILSHSVIKTAAVQASDLMPILNDSFEFLSLLNQPSQIGSQHPIVGATSVGGSIKIDGYIYNIVTLIL